MGVNGATGGGRNLQGIPGFTVEELRDAGCQYHQPTCSTCHWDKCYLDVWDNLPRNNRSKKKTVASIYGSIPVFVGD